MLCTNPNPEAISLLHRHIESEYIDWEYLSENPNALPLLEKYPEKINWNYASNNFAILSFLEKHLDQVNWDWFCHNYESTTPEVIRFLEKHAERLSSFGWKTLSSDPIAVPLLEKYPEHIYWKRLCENPNAIHLLEKHPENINWKHLSSNPNAMHLLFKLDHKQMKQQNARFKEELNTYVFDPDRMIRLSKGIELRTYLSMY
jgi:hypothetical protein